MAWRRRWFIVLPFLCGVFGTLVVSSQLPDLFQSEMLIQVVPQRVPDTYVQSTVTMRTQDRINALSQQAMSRTELERLIEAFDLYEAERSRMPMQDVVERMRASVDVEIALGGARGSDAEAFYVRFQYLDAGVATQVTARIGGLFIEQNSRDRGALAEGTNEFLETQLANARVRLEEQERRLESFREQYAGRLPDQLGFNMQAMQNTQLRLQALVQSLARDRDRKSVLERLYDDAQTEEAAASAAVVAAVSQEGELVDLAELEEAVTGTATAQRRLALARSALSGLRLRLRPEHPDVMRIERLIEDLQREITASPADTSPADLSPEQLLRRERLRERRAEVESTRREIEFKESELLRLREALAQYEQRIEAVPGLESEWIALSRDYATQQRSYEGLLAKSEQAKVAADLERRQIGEQFRVLDPPRVPGKPASPNRLLISALGTLGSLFLGLGWAALIEVCDSTYQSASEVAEVLALPVIGLVPYVQSEADRRWEAARRVLAATSCEAIARGTSCPRFWHMGYRARCRRVPSLENGIVALRRVRPGKVCHGQSRAGVR